MTLFPGSAHESAPTNTIILPNPHPEADSACAGHPPVSRADGSLRSISERLQPCVTPPPSPLPCEAGPAHACVCTCARYADVHTSVLGLEQGQLQAGRQGPGSACFPASSGRCLQSWFSWGWVLFPDPVLGGGVTFTTSSSQVREGRGNGRGQSGPHHPEWMGLLDTAPSQGLGGCWECSSRPAFPSGWGLQGGGHSGLQWPLQPRGTRSSAPGSCWQLGDSAGPAWGRSAALVLTSGTRPEWNNL